jgi:thioredoxin
MDGKIVRCRECGQNNHVPENAQGKTIRCGKCKTPLTVAANDNGHQKPVELTDDNFKSEIGSGPAVIDFWAAWCGPCRMIGPVIDQLAAERNDVRFGKLNVDQNPRTSQTFKVQGIPLLVFMKDGVERGRLVGAVPRPQIEAAIRQYLS